MKKRLVYIVMAAGALSALVSGCGGNNGGNSTQSSDKNSKTTISFWYWIDGQSETKAINDLVSAYEHQHPNVKVNAVLYPYADMKNRITAGLASGSLPDLVWLSSGDVQDYVKSGKAVPISTEFASDWNSIQQNFYKSWLPFGEVGGTMYAPPIDGSAMGVIVNKDIWDQTGLGDYPHTWAQMTDDAKKLTKANQYGLTFWGSPYSKYAWALYQYHFLYPNHLDPWGNDGKQVTYNSPQDVAALQQLYDWATIDKVGQKGGDIKQNFLQGKTAMVLGEAGHIGYYEAHAKFKIDAFPDPTSDGSVASMIGAQNLMMFKSNPTQEKAAWDFTKFMLTDVKWIDEWMKVTGNFTPYQPAAESSDYKQWLHETPALEHLAAAVPSGVPRITYAGETDIEKVLNDQIQAVVLGRTAPQSALDNVQKAANQILQKQH